MYKDILCVKIPKYDTLLFMKYFKRRGASLPGYDASIEEIIYTILSRTQQLQQAQND